MLEALGSSDKKFSEIEDPDRDITDSDGGNDSDFQPKVTETKRKKSNISSKICRSETEKRKRTKPCDALDKINITNKYIQRAYNHSQNKCPSPTAPKRKSQKIGVGLLEGGNISCQGKSVITNSSISRFQRALHEKNKLLELQLQLNKMLEGLCETIPNSLQRIGTTFVTNDKSYAAPTGVLLKFLLDAAIFDKPTRDKPVSLRRCSARAVLYADLYEIVGATVLLSVLPHPQLIFLPFFVGCR